MLEHLQKLDARLRLAQARRAGALEIARLQRLKQSARERLALALNRPAALV
jgi:hypothetical protein